VLFGVFTAYRNRPLTDEDLDNMFPKEGYKVLKPPDGYVRRDNKLLAAPSSSSSSSSSTFAADAVKKSGFSIQSDAESGLGAAMNVRKFFCCLCFYLLLFVAPPFDDPNIKNITENVKTHPFSFFPLISFLFFQGTNGRGNHAGRQR
jgi:hypothetical protein